MNKTEIKLGVVRTIKTADFESLHISAEIKEVVEWSNEEERNAGIEVVNDHLIKDFSKGYISIVNSIGIQRSLATGKLENKKTGETSQANVITDTDEVDIFGE